MNWKNILLTSVLIATTIYNCKPHTELKISNNTGKKTFISQEEGEQDLQILAQYKNKEDAWIYFDGMWADIGTNITNNSVSKSNSTILNAIPEDVLSSITIHEYHTHPGNEFINNTPPGPSDYKSLAENKKFLRAQRNVNVVGNVVTATGVWTYDLTRHLTYKLTSPQEQLQKKVSSQLSEQTFYLAGRVFTNPDLNKEEQIQSFIDSMKVEGVLMQYKPFEKN